MSEIKYEFYTEVSWAWSLPARLYTASAVEITEHLVLLFPSVISWLTHLKVSD